MALDILNRLRRRLLGTNASSVAAASEHTKILDWGWSRRCAQYDEWESLYANSIYDDTADGGYRQDIITNILQVDDNERPLNAYYNPTACIVDAYQNCFRGLFGREIRIAETVGSVAEGQVERKVNPQILDPLFRIWRWSNLNDQKESLQTWCANLGSVGLRIEAPLLASDGTPLPPERRSVRIRPIHPRQIIDLNEDNEGNVSDVLIEYSVTDGTLSETHESDVTRIRETLTRDVFIREDPEGARSAITNDLGICPFVLLRQKDIGARFGAPAHHGSDKILHNLNWLLTRVSISVDRNVFAKWFAAASGSAPSTIALGDTEVAYVQTAAGDTAPKLEAIVAKLDFLGMERILTFLIAHLRQRQPELVLSALEAMSGQSGETIAKLLVPVEERIMIARARYEHALMRAAQIGLSWGIFNGIWDVGTGTGSADAADRAYREGFEDFQFNQRSALPETIFDRINRAKADQAIQQERLNTARMADGLLPLEDRLRIIGVPENKIAGIVETMQSQEVTEDNEQ